MKLPKVTKKVTIWNIIDQQSNYWDEHDGSGMVRGFTLVAIIFIIILIAICR